MIDLFNLSRRNPFDRVHENHLATFFDETLGALCRQAVQFAVLLVIYALVLALFWTSGLGDQQAKLSMLGPAFGIIGGVVLRLLDQPDQLHGDRVPPGGCRVVPPLPHTAAIRIGQRLAGKWDSLIRPEVPEWHDLVWADLVQYVLLKAREAQREQAPDCSAP